MGDFVRYVLEDGSEVFFETSESALVSRRGGGPQVNEGGELGDRLANISQAAAEISQGLREKLGPDEVELSFGVKVSGNVGWWFIAKAGGEASIAVTLRWKDRLPGSDGGGSSSSQVTGIDTVESRPGRVSPAVAVAGPEVANHAGGE